MDSALRLLGGANATGAIAAGVTFHTFEKNADIQNALKLAAVLFLFGICTFTITYAALYVATHDLDHSLHKEGEETWPDYLFWVPTKSPEEYKKTAYRELVVVVFGMMASFVLFIMGLGVILFMASHFQLGS
jgi:hypothetical protein